MSTIVACIGGYDYPVRGCNACPAPMVWAVSESTGKSIPLDALAVPDGNLVYVRQLTDGGAPRPVVRHLKRDEDPGPVPRFKTHFATCPSAPQFRK